MQKQREVEARAKAAEQASKDEERRKQEEEDKKLGNRLKASLNRTGEAIKGTFTKVDDKVSQSVDGKHISNGGVSPRK